ncbi:MAG TPA: glutathione S-transferase family protein [Hyphomicrobium sp.]|jgi:glutathione S-transferase|nr:glutathione S-transferase family protein [Hyphomicrobium sp.]
MAEKTLTHYHAPNTRSFTIRWLFEELGAPHELKVLNLKKGEHKTPEHLAINPMGKVPAVVHGTTPITEVGAIAIYLADLFPEAGLTPAIGDPERGTYLRWIIFNQSAVEPALCDFALKREPGQPSMMPYGTYGETVDALAGALSKGPYILGERFSAADVVVGSGVRWMLMFKLLPERPEFTSYADRVTHRPAFVRAMTKDAELAKVLAA